MNNRYIIVFLMFCACCRLYSQEKKTIHDSTIIVRDSVIYNSVDSASSSVVDSSKYKALQSLTERSAFAAFLHRAIFRPLGRGAPPPLYEGQKLESAFHSAAQGKIIRKISIITLDPFGNNIRDTSEHPHTLLFKTGNWVHTKTNIGVIKNLLLLRENQVYDSLMAKESERLLRSHDFIRDIYLSVIGSTADSVDLELRAVDVWSLLPFLSRKSTETGIGFSDLNFAGTGSRLEITGWWKKYGGGNITHVSYLLPNFRNSYISLNVQFLFAPGGNLLDLREFGHYYYSPVSSNPQYMFPRNNNIVRSVEINRPFYSPVARWAGGIFYGQIMTTQNWISSDTLRYLSARTNIQDLWGGRSWQIGREKPTGRITSFVLSGRFVRTYTPNRSAEIISARLFPTHTYFFGSVSLSSRKYYRDKYIFNYGKIEDVPSGRIAGITFGEDFQQRSRLYIGLYAGIGNYYRFGYLSTFLSYGTFKNSTDGFQQGILTGRITYFTPLLSIGDWRIRQFVRPTFVFGINKSPADNQPLNVGIKGFEAVESRASSVSIISLQTQTYAPWDIAGFHFGPYIFTHIGLLGEPGRPQGRLYSLVGLGVLIKNDYLMFSTFQLSLSFYPYLPVNRHNIFKTNAYKTSDYGFKDFEVTKPGIVE
ncbi:MAG TPA: hypothetical protein VK155_04715 [Bacteroidales bacterium]|nr:hypothetical protein [Bacteroidales bacterium]